MSYSGPATGMPDPMALSVMTDDVVQVAHWAGATGASSAHPSSALAVFYPVRLTETHTYTKAWWLNGATAAGNVDVGIYTLSGTTLTRVVASTAAAQSGTSAMQVATTFTTTTIGPGLYYLALSASLNTATFWRCNMSLGLLRTLGMFQAATSHPLPATATAAVVTSNYLPVFGFSEDANI